MAIVVASNDVVFLKTKAQSRGKFKNTTTMHRGEQLIKTTYKAGFFFLLSFFKQKDPIANGCGLPSFNCFLKIKN